MHSLRLWPGIVTAALIPVGYAVLVTAGDAAVLGLILALLGGLATVAWWLFFSRAAWVDRLGGLAIIAAALVAVRPLLDRSITNGAMGNLPYLATPVLAFGLAAGVFVARHGSRGLQRIAIVASVVIAAGFCTLVRTGGVLGSGGFDLHWRWTPTPEDLLLAKGDDDPIQPAATTPISTPISTATSSTPASVTAAAPITPRKPADWPGFRGRNRDGVVHGVRINTDWSTSPPVQLWQRPIGPGWSSFAVDRGLIYTQEQRGEDEIVVCYRMSTGEPVWRHRDKTRFWESNGGAGPRGTPTLVDGRVYTLGATGIVNVLDADTGAVIWSRNAATDTKTKVPMWGFTSSPLLHGDLVIVAASGNMVAYEVASGTPRWFGPARKGSYSSPQLVTLGGVQQIVLLGGNGASGVSPDTGALLWDHAFGEGPTIVQPATTEDGDLLINAISMTGGLGIQRLAVKQLADKWTVTERWTSSGLKPYFNDLVVHRGHAYGFDGSILSCIDLADGKRVWKGGRYGAGQLVLLADEHVLLVVSEEGDLALVSATPDGFKELAHVPAIEGKTWNHPVLVGDTLLVRNGEQMAAFKIAMATR